MVSSKPEGGLLHNIKLSSVGPGSVTGQDIVYEPSEMDLAMKLHYIRGVYYFESRAFEGLSVVRIKEPMFTWFNHFYQTCARFRRSESGRPYLKCNDCGVRFIEADCDKTLEEWLQMKDASLEKLLASEQVLGPELMFSPLVLLQFTKFKCGGVAMGLSWAHVLGDTFSAVEFMNALGKVEAGQKLPRPLNLSQSLTMCKSYPDPPNPSDDPISVKRVGPVEDYWINISSCEMDVYSFYVTATQLCHLQSRLSGKNGTNPTPFEALAAVFWQCIGKIREEPDTKIVTICQKGSKEKKDKFLSNSQIINLVKVDFSVEEASPSELLQVIKNESVDQRKKIEETIDRENGLADFIVYGANLTFVNMEEADFYGFEWRGEKPVRVTWRIDGVGDQGAVFVLPGTRDICREGEGGRIVTVVLPEHEISQLKSELKREWSIVN